MAFTVIEPAPDLTPAERRHVADVGPSDVLVRTSYRSLLGSAGFVDVVADDVTSAYRTTMAAWFRETECRADAVIARVGSDEFEQRQQRRSSALAAIDAGLLRRQLYVARRARAGPS
jgi:hypothetical protein